jgi:hypothetical protein
VPAATGLPRARVKKLTGPDLYGHCLILADVPTLCAARRGTGVPGDGPTDPDDGVETSVDPEDFGGKQLGRIEHGLERGEVCALYISGLRHPWSAVKQVRLAGFSCPYPSPGERAAEPRARVEAKLAQSRTPVAQFR